MPDNEESEWGLPNPAGSEPPAPTPPAASWQPPHVEPTASAAPDAGAPQPSAPVVVAGSPRGQRSRGKVVGAVVGVAALVGAGVFAVTQIGGGDDAGGAASPEEAVQQLLDALGDEDILGAADLLLPGERNTYRDPLVDIVDELARLRILDEGADLGAVGGLDIQFDNVEIDTDATNVDDIVNTTFTADVTVAVNGDEVPIGEYLIETAFGGDRPDLDVDATEDTVEDVPLTTVEHDGKWYVSLIYTAAEAARDDTDFDIPEAEEAIVPVGGDSPEAAVEGFVNAIAGLDLEQIVAGLNPDEAEVLQRYAPLFIDDAQSELNDVEVDISIDDLQLSTTEINGSTSVLLDAVSVTIDFEGERAEITLADGCYVVEAPGESFDSCDQDTAQMVEDVLGDLPPELDEAIETVTEAFSDLEVGGVTVREVDGSWYVSPIATLTDFGVNVLRALDSEELDDITGSVEALVEAVYSGEIAIDDYVPMDELPVEGFPIDEPSFDDEPASTVPTETFPAETVPVDTTATDETIPEESTFDDSALSACFAILEAQEGLACVRDGVANGTIDAETVNPAYLHPECGVAELQWTFDYYGLPDADFDAVVAAAAACFAPLIESGEVDEFWLSPEFVHPECLPGGNIYASDSDTEYEAFLDCAYASE